MDFGSYWFTEFVLDHLEALEVFWIRVSEVCFFPVKKTHGSLYDFEARFSVLFWVGWLWIWPPEEPIKARTLRFSFVFAVWGLQRDCSTTVSNGKHLKLLDFEVETLTYPYSQSDFLSFAAEKWFLNSKSVTIEILTALTPTFGWVDFLLIVRVGAITKRKQISSILREIRIASIWMWLVSRHWNTHFELDLSFPKFLGVRLDWTRFDSSIWISILGFLSTHISTNFQEHEHMEFRFGPNQWSWQESATSIWIWRLGFLKYPHFN